MIKWTRIALPLSAAALVLATFATPAFSATSAGFDINGYIVGSWRNVDNGRVYTISKGNSAYVLGAGSAWKTGEGCNVNMGDVLYTLTPKQTVGGYLNGGDYVGPWRQLKKEASGACTWLPISPGQSGYYEGISGFVPTTGPKTAENPDGQTMNWFCAYTGPYTQCASLSRIGPGFVQPGAKPTPTPTPTPTVPPLAKTAEYGTFLGLGDPNTPDCSAARTQRAAEIATVGQNYPGATNDVAIRGEKLVLGAIPNSASLLQIYRLLGKTDIPQALNTNVYARATRTVRGGVTLEDRLRAAILASGGQLNPDDVLGLALQVTGGSYPMAVLTAHNLLKGVAVTGRNIIEQWPVAGAKSHPAMLAELGKQSAVVGKLASLRCEPAVSRDKVGPWYHSFAVLTGGALVGADFAPLIVAAEHGGKAANTALRKMRQLLGYALPANILAWIPDGFFSGEGGFDPEKAAFDAAVSGAALQLRPLSR
ncbi:MAG: hypothetical protein Q7L55_08655 [Actinomycetota bacterium]|nr:hypothetical protein [Actinomycetota bacterium]